MESNRRDFLKKTSFLALAGLSTQFFSSGLKASTLFQANGSSEFSLPALPYAYDALEPSIDKLTMEIHHSKHHLAYVTNLNKALKESGMEGSLDEFISHASKYPIAIRNNAGGHWNHSFFWKIMMPGGSGEPAGRIGAAIIDSFGTFEEFKKKFEEAGMKRFGSGWVWLTVDSSNKLIIGSTPNQDNPLMDVSEFKGAPVLGTDVWEHAYYLKYQNRRAEYLNAWWNTLNWNQINLNYEAGLK